MFAHTVLALILAGVAAPTCAMMNDAHDRDIDAALALRFMMDMDHDPWMRSAEQRALRGPERAWSYDSHTKKSEDSSPPLFTLPKESHERDIAILFAFCALVILFGIVNFARA